MKITTKLRLLIVGLMATLASVGAVAVWQACASRTANDQSYKGETVATDGSFGLKAILMRGLLGSTD